MEEKDVVRALAALAQPLRLRVFRALVVAGPAGLTPGAMAEGLGIPPNDACRSTSRSWRTPAWSRRSAPAAT